MWLSEITVLRDAVQQVSGRPAAYQVARRILSPATIGTISRQVAVFDITEGAQSYAWVEPEGDEDWIVVVVVEAAGAVVTPAEAVWFFSTHARASLQ
jgi:hypothetical protein